LGFKVDDVLLVLWSQLPQYAYTCY